METQTAVCVDISRDQLKLMAQKVETALECAVRALLESDPVTAKFVIEDDKAINSFEIDIDNSTYNFLAVNMRDIPPEMLRLVLSIQKINPILERIGDHAVNIAESAETISRHATGCDLFELPKMAGLCKEMLHDALSSFFEESRGLAKEVLTRDGDVDKLNLTITEEVKARVISGQKGLSFEMALEIIRVCKNLERIADLSSNIAEEAVFSIAGRLVKHHSGVTAAVDNDALN